MAGSKAMDPPPFTIPRVSGVPPSFLVYKKPCLVVCCCRFSLCLYASAMPKSLCGFIVSSVRRLEGAMKDSIPNPQIFVTHKPAPPLSTKWASMLWSTLSGLNDEFAFSKCAPQNYKMGGGVRVGPKAGGWVSSKIPPPLL